MGCPQAPRGVYGQNYLMGKCPAEGDKSSVERVKESCENWYDEGRWYKGSRVGKFSPTTAMFTQMVWKSSTKLGIGFCKKGKVWAVVALYEPPGNMGDFTENVQKK